MLKALAGAARHSGGMALLPEVQEIVDGDEPTEMNLFIVRTRLDQAELDPAAAEEARRLRTVAIGDSHLPI